MICEKCGNTHDGKFGSGRFCSLICSRSRSHTDETKDKIRKSVNLYIENTPIELRVKQLSEDQIRDQVEKSRKTWNDKLLHEDFKNLTFERRRKRVILEQENRCSKCGIDSWNGDAISLEIDHIDGNRNNNVRENLTALCPNCHSQTDTWRGRNKSLKRIKISDDEIIDAYIKSHNIRQTLILLGLAPKGANYGRVKRALTLNGIKY